MENEYIRRYYNMSNNETGVLVLSTAPLSPASSMLQKGDVLLSVDNIRIANDASIPLREGSFRERVQLNYYFTQKFATDTVDIKLLRDSQVLNLQVPLWVPQKLVPRTLLSRDTIDKESNKGTGCNGSIVGGTPSYLMYFILYVIFLFCIDWFLRRKRFITL